MTANCRLYSFVHTMLKPIQHGIQTAHVLGVIAHDALDMATLASPEHMSMKDAEFVDLVRDYVCMDHTIIVLDGGVSAQLTDIATTISEYAKLLNLPYGTFHEDHASMCGMMTAVGILVPESIWALDPKAIAASVAISVDPNPLTSPDVSVESKLRYYLSTFRLA